MTQHNIITHKLVDFGVRITMDSNLRPMTILKPAFGNFDHVTPAGGVIFLHHINSIFENLSTTITRKLALTNFEVV